MNHEWTIAPGDKSLRAELTRRYEVVSKVYHWRRRGTDSFLGQSRLPGAGDRCPIEQLPKP
jgi:hypothetical protein